jgi:D-apionolactonase
MADRTRAVSIASATEKAAAEAFLRGPAAPPLPPELPVRAGSLSAVLSGIDLAHVASGEVEVARLIQVAVRDEVWGTVPPVVSGLCVERDDDAFLVTFRALCAADEIEFEWSGRMEGRPDGTLTYAMSGVAGRAFRYGRIGICILHPAEAYAGRRYRGTTAGGGEAGEFPRAIFAQRLVGGVYVPLAGPWHGLDVELAPDVTASFAFEGDEFEMEDQRNWTDATFKTYSTPLSLGLVHEAVAGQTLDQRVTLTCRSGGQVAASPASEPARRPSASRSTIELLEELDAVVPAIGAVCRELPASPAAVSAIARLGLHHHRVDVDLETQPDDVEWLERARLAAAAGAELELALTVGEATAGHAAGVLDAARKLAPIARVLVLDAAGEVSAPALVAAVRAAAAAAGLAVPIAGGTDLWFAELNRNAPVGAIDMVSFSITPQCHVGDDESLFETLPAQAAAVAAAKQLYAGLPIAVTPVTLSLRDVLAIRAGHAEASDPRQPSLLCAAWTAGSIAQLSAAGAQSLSYFELLGPRGLMPAAAGAVPAAPGALVFPAYHVLCDARLRTGRRVVATALDAPGRVAAGACRIDDRCELSVVNLTPQPQRVIVAGVGGSGPVKLRCLDGSTLHAAMYRPREFRSETQEVAVARGRIGLDLGPYAVCTAHWGGSDA